MDVMCLLFLGYNRQHIPVCAKMIMSGLRKFLGIAKANMSVGIIKGAAVSAAFVAGVSLVSLLQAGDCQSFYSSYTLFFTVYHYHRSVPGSGAVCCPGLW